MYPFWKTWLKELNPFWVWLKELNLFFFEKWPIELKLFMNFFSIWLKELNFYNDSKISIFEKVDAENWTFFLNMTQRSGPFFKTQKFYPLLNATQTKIWTYFSNMTQRIEPIFSVTQRILIFFQKFLTQRMNFLESMTQRNEPNFFRIWLKELNLLMTRGIWPFLFNLNQRIEPFFFSNLTQKNWTSFMNMTQRVGFWIWLKECFLLWLSELNLVLHMTLRPFLHDSKK